MTSKIGRFALNNDGAFVVEMYITYTQPGSDKPKQTKHTENILPGRTLLLSPNQLGVPDLSTVTLCTDVDLSYRDRVAKESFLFDNESAMCAYYKADGTLLNHSLELERVDVPEWRNWSHNIVYKPPDRSYFYPHNRTELRDIVLRAAAGGYTVRVSGQRHSQSGLVAFNARDKQPVDARLILVDLACYSDLGNKGTERMMLNGNEVTVNTGVREDELDAFLTRNNKIMKTVTAGGFFSIGGMTSVDVHGGTVDQGIFADTVVAFHIMGPDGEVTTINKSTQGVTVNGVQYSALQFARVNLGALGVVTSVTLSVQDRPYANSLVPDTATFTARDSISFAREMLPLLKNNDRVEVFFNPYNGDAMALMWSVVPPSEVKPTPNEDIEIPSACVTADKEEYGAPNAGKFEGLSQSVAQTVQDSRITTLAIGMNEVSFKTIKEMFKDAVEKKTDLWLTEAPRTMFMSYFVPLPSFDEAGLRFAWVGINAVMDRLARTEDFLMTTPMEFRIVRAGDAVMAGTFTERDSSVTHYINLDMIGFTDSVESKEYPENLQSFFCDIERVWFKDMGGLPHNGKMFGFFDPVHPNAKPNGAFNDNFMRHLAGIRKDRLTAFEQFRSSRDAAGMFLNDHVSKLLGTY